MSPAGPGIRSKMAVESVGEHAHFALERRCVIAVESAPRSPEDLEQRAADDRA